MIMSPAQRAVFALAHERYRDALRSERSGDYGGAIHDYKVASELFEMMGAKDSAQRARNDYIKAHNEYVSLYN